MTHPTREPLLACSLSAAAAAERAERWQSLLDNHLLTRSATPGGTRLVFAADPAAAAELDALVAAEAACCAFLSLTVEDTDERLSLDVAAPPVASAIVQTMFGARA